MPRRLLGSTALSLLGAFLSVPAFTSAPRAVPQPNLVAAADSAWQVQRYDLAAVRFRQVWETLSPSDERDRAGVMAARAWLELGSRDEAVALLEEVAAGPSRGYWWGRSLYHLARLAPRFADPWSGRDDSLGVAGEIDAAMSRLRRSLEHFAARAAEDSTWQEALIDVHIEFLGRLHTVEELAAALVRAVQDAVTNEQQAAVRMAYVDSLSRIRPGQFLPELRRQTSDEIRERIRQALDYVIDNLAETTRAPAAYAALADQCLGSDPRRYFELLKELADRYPHTAEGVRAQSALDQETAFVNMRVLQRAWPTTDSVLIHLSSGRARQVDARVWRLDDRDALEWWARDDHGRMQPPADVAMLRLIEIPLAGWRSIDTTLAWRLPMGSYVCRAQAGTRQTQVDFRVTDHQLLHHVKGDSILVSVVSPRAEPVPEALVEVYEITPLNPRDRQPLEIIPVGAWKTGVDGKAVVRVGNGAGGKVASPKKLLLMSHVGDQVDLAWEYQGPVKQVSGAVWMDRTVYRPGEEVAFQIICLHGPAHVMAPAPPDTLRVWAAMPTLERLHTARWESTMTANEYGGASGAFIIPAGAADGEVSIGVMRTYGIDDGRSLCSARAMIRAFDRPDVDLAVKLRASEVLLGDSLKVDVTARTAHGVPLTGARVTLSASFVEMHRRYRVRGELAQGWYGPADQKAASYHDHPRSVKSPLGSFVAVVDDSGCASFCVPGPAPPRGTLVQYLPRTIAGVILDVGLDDAAGGHESRRLEVPVFPGRAWCTAAEDAFGIMVGQKIRDGVTVRRLDNGNRPSPGLVHFRWVRRIPDLANDRYVETTIDSGQVATLGNAVVHLSSPQRNRDELVLDVWADSTARTATRIGPPPERDLSGSELPWGFLGERDPQQWIAVDRLQYSVGDTARVLLAPALRRLPGILWVGAGGFRRRPYPLPAGMVDSIVSIPIQAAQLPDAFVSWSPVHGRERSGPQEGVPSDRIVVEPSSRLLSLTIRTDRREYAPGDSVVVRVAAVDPAGRPVKALVTVGAVDEAVYSIAPDGFDIARELYQLTWDGPLTAALRASFPPPPAPPARLAFRATAFWEPALVTDGATGTATLVAVLPDDLARWRLTARAVDLRGRVGEAREHFVTHSPLRIRPRLPRFVRVGDRFEFGAWVDNDSDETLGCELESAKFSTSLMPRSTVLAGPGRGAPAPSICRSTDR